MRVLIVKSKQQNEVAWVFVSESDDPKLEAQLKRVVVGTQRCWHMGVWTISKEDLLRQTLVEQGVDAQLVEHEIVRKVRW